MQLLKLFVLVLSVLLLSCESKTEGKAHQILSPTTNKVTSESATINKPAKKKETKVNDQQKEIITVFEIEPWMNFFFHQEKATCFNEDSIHQFEKSILRKGVDSSAVIDELAHQVYNKTELYPWEESALEYTDYLYSIQTQKGHTGIVVFGMNEGWVYQLKYYSYDHLGRKVDEIPLAEWGGDGGYFRESNGCFINDSIYHYEFLETEYNFENETTEVIDSGEIQYVIHENGDIDKTFTNSENHES